MMAGGEELEELGHELAEMAHQDRVSGKMADIGREVTAEAEAMRAVDR